MATEVSAAPMALPQLQSVQKAMAIPTVGAAVGQFGALYSRVKDAHSLLEWALSTAEAGVTLAAHTAAPFVSAPLAAGDAKVAACIDALERRVPLVNEQPEVIVETTKKAVMSKISPHVNKVIGARVAAEQRVKSLKELSWAKANSLLNTAYGQKALIGVDNGAIYAMQLLDHYLPPLGPQEEPSKEIVAATNDPALHTVQTVGRLSAVAARRVWANLAFKVTELRQSGIEFDVSRYLKALLAALHLATVTGQQQQQEAAPPARPEPASPAQPPAPASPAPPARAAPARSPAQPPAPPARAAPASPAQPPAPRPAPAHDLKTTPEGKSENHSNNHPN